MKRSLGTRLSGFWQLSHPGPVLFHTIAVTLFALLASLPHPNWVVVCLIVGAHTAMQMAIAMLNDYCDREMDASSKRNKPIARGLVTPREALVAGCGMIALMLVLLLFLPPLGGIISLLYLALGLAYNLGLKSTPLSGIVFALAMPLIPLYAFASTNHTIPFLLWLIPVGFLLGVALNLANSLPDLEEDRASGARTLAVLLGVRGAFLVGNIVMVLSALLILVLNLTKLVVVQPLVLYGILALAAILLFTIFSSTGPGYPPATRRRYFYLVTLICLVQAGGWFIGVFIGGSA